MMAEKCGLFGMETDKQPSITKDGKCSGCGKKRAPVPLFFLRQIGTHIGCFYRMFTPFSLFF